MTTQTTITSYNMIIVMTMNQYNTITPKQIQNQQNMQKKLSKKSTYLYTWRKITPKHKLINWKKRWIDDTEHEYVTICNQGNQPAIYQISLKTIH